MATKGLSSIHVGEMHLYERNVHRKQRIAQGDARGRCCAEGVAAGDQWALDGIGQVFDRGPVIGLCRCRVVGRRSLTRTDTAPAFVTDGVTQLSAVALVTCTLVAAFPPNVTLVSADVVNPPPTMITRVPPLIGPI